MSIPITTPNVSLQYPAFSAGGWQVPLNYDLTLLDLLLSGKVSLPGLLMAGAICFAASATTPADIGISRVGVGVLAFGNGTPGDTTAVVQAGSFVGSGTGLTGLGALVIEFALTSAVAGSNVGPMKPAAIAAAFSQCLVVVKSSDGTTGLAFMIRKNGVACFAANVTVPAATASGSVFAFTPLTSVPFAVSARDVFTIDVVTGTSSWSFTAQLS
jgi:hypothetical protein